MHISDSGYHWKNLFLLQKLSITDANFGQRRRSQTWSKGQDLSWPVTGGTGVNRLIKEVSPSLSVLRLSFPLLPVEACAPHLPFHRLSPAVPWHDGLLLFTVLYCRCICCLICLLGRAKLDQYQSVPGQLRTYSSPNQQ